MVPRVVQQLVCKRAGKAVAPKAGKRGQIIDSCDAAGEDQRSGSYHLLTDLSDVVGNLGSMAETVAAEGIVPSLGGALGCAEAMGRSGPPSPQARQILDRTDAQRGRRPVFWKVLQLAKHPKIALSRSQASEFQPVAKVTGSVLGEEQPTDASRLTADRGKKGIDPLFRVFSREVGVQDVVSGWSVSDDPCGLPVDLNSDSVLVVKESEILDVVQPQGLDQVRVIHQVG